MDAVSGVDIAPGPEMKSTGEVMGIDEDFDVALIKSTIAANMNVALQGTAFVSVKDDDKPHLEKIVHSLDRLGFHIVATLRHRRSNPHAWCAGDDCEQSFGRQPEYRRRNRQGQDSFNNKHPVEQKPRERRNPYSHNRGKEGRHADHVDVGGGSLS